MKTVAIIGAGAAGIMASLNVKDDYKVILLDGNDKCGKKLLLTGNGRCNYWNEDISVDMYETDSREKLSAVLLHSEKTLNCLERLGVYPKIKNGYYYPYSNQAASIREIFQKKIEEKNIDFKPGFKVCSIVKNNNFFVIKSTNREEIKADKVVIACGSKSYEKTGSDGSGYDIAKKLGHNINKVHPALCSLISSGKFLKEWEKIRLDAEVSLFADGRFVKKDLGEIQLTSTGISGICTFNISGAAAKNMSDGKHVEVKINFMPNLHGGFYNWIDNRCKMLGNVTLENALESIFNYKLMFVLFKMAKVSKDDIWEYLSEDKKRKLCKTVEEFTVEILGTESFDKSQVCTGGVPLNEVNPETMESLKQEGLYLAGEILDVDGRCGGYNLAFAFTSGYIAGRNI